MQLHPQRFAFGVTRLQFFPADEKYISILQDEGRMTEEAVKRRGETPPDMPNAFSESCRARVCLRVLLRLALCFELPASLPINSYHAHLFIPPRTKLPTHHLLSPNTHTQLVFFPRCMAAEEVLAAVAPEPVPSDDPVQRMQQRERALRHLKSRLSRADGAGDAGDQVSGGGKRQHSGRSDRSRDSSSGSEDNGGSSSSSSSGSSEDEQGADESKNNSSAVGGGSRSNRASGSRTEPEDEAYPSYASADGGSVRATPSARADAQRNSNNNDDDDDSGSGSGSSGDDEDDDAFFASSEKDAKQFTAYTAEEDAVRVDTEKAAQALKQQQEQQQQQQNKKKRKRKRARRNKAAKTAE